MSGPAGSGKTTILLYALEECGIPLENVLFMTYVGQASLVLRLKGLDGRTIHSTIYELEEELVRDENGQLIIQNGKPKKKLKWRKVSNLPKHIELIVIDEGSTVPGSIAKDIESFGIKILVVGDLDQLDPVFGSPPYLKDPDAILTKVMRQNDERGILDIIDLILKENPLKVGKYKKSAIITRDMVTDKILKNSSIILCGKNKTRNILNDKLRKLHGRSGQLPVVGDKLICRRNNWREEIDGIPLVNGMRGEVVNPIDLSTFNTNSKTFRMDFRPEFMKDNYFENLVADYKYLRLPCGSKTNYKSYGFSNKFEFGYAITTHLSQGSQYPSVLVFEEMLTPKIHKKLMYTGVSRAEYLVVLVKREKRKQSKSVWV